MGCQAPRSQTAPPLSGASRQVGRERPALSHPWSGPVSHGAQPPRTMGRRAFPSRPVNPRRAQGSAARNRRWPSTLAQTWVRAAAVRRRGLPETDAGGRGQVNVPRRVQHHPANKVTSHPERSNFRLTLATVAPPPHHRRRAYPRSSGPGADNLPVQLQRHLRACGWGCLSIRRRTERGQRRVRAGERQTGKRVTTQSGAFERPRTGRGLGQVACAPIEQPQPGSRHRASVTRPS